MHPKNKILIAAIALLLILVLLFFLKFCNKKTTLQINYVLQGSTTLDYGNIKMKIWDNNTEDGDSVKVYIDNELVRDSIALAYQPLELNFGKLSKGEHQLGVVAINEGTTSPASATIGLSNESANNEFEMNATKDSAASWKIIIK